MAVGISFLEPSLLSILKPLLSSVALSYFILAVPIREVWEKSLA